MNRSSPGRRETLFLIMAVALTVAGVAGARWWHERAQSAGALAALLAPQRAAVPFACPFAREGGTVVDFGGVRLRAARQETPRREAATEPGVYLVSLYYRHEPAVGRGKGSISAAVLQWYDAEGALLVRVPFLLEGEKTAVLGGVVQESPPLVLPRRAVSLSVRLWPGAQRGEGLLVGCALLLRADS